MPDRLTAAGANLEYISVLDGVRPPFSEDRLLRHASFPRATLFRAKLLLGLPSCKTAAGWVWRPSNHAGQESQKPPAQGGDS